MTYNLGKGSLIIRPERESPGTKMQEGAAFLDGGTPSVSWDGEFSADPICNDHRASAGRRVSATGKTAAPGTAEEIRSAGSFPFLAFHLPHPAARAVCRYSSLPPRTRRITTENSTLFENPFAGGKHKNPTGSCRPTSHQKLSKQIFDRKMSTISVLVIGIGVESFQLFRKTFQRLPLQRKAQFEFEIVGIGEFEASLVAVQVLEVSVVQKFLELFLRHAFHFEAFHCDLSWDN
ncbi:unnamed protein product, partial [Nesidiocoris tenuis]